MTKDRARFAIGIDLGTTNSALAFAPLVGEGTPEVLLVPQWEGLARLAEKPTLPSFLYLPEEAVAAHLRGEEVGIVMVATRRDRGPGSSGLWPLPSIH